MIPDSTIAVNNWRDIDESANLDLLGRCAPVFGSTLPFTQAGRQPRRSNSLWRSANELGILLFASEAITLNGCGSTQAGNIGRGKKDELYIPI